MNKNISREQELLTIIAELQTKNSELQKRLTILETELAKLRKNSSTSSNPPSSDIVKPPKKSETDTVIFENIISPIYSNKMT